MSTLLHSPLSLFILQVVVIITLARTLGFAARRVGQPLVIAEILAGILLGPSFLGLFFPQFYTLLFPKSSLPLMHVVSQIGLILFMFLIGLELDTRTIRHQGRSSLIISASRLIFPFLIGAILGLSLHARFGGPNSSPLSLALLMGTAMAIVAFPVLARILSERRMLHSPIGVVAITSAAVNDVVAWCMLAFVVSVSQASGAGQAVITTLMALGYVAFMLLGMRPFLRRLGSRSTNREGLTQNVVALILVMVFLSALFTELIGVHAVLGAFLLGAVIPKEEGFVQTLGEKLEDVVVVFLLPLFFAYTGIRTDLGLLNTPSLWGMAGLITLVASVAAMGSTVIAAKVVGMGWREGSALGVLMNTRGLMELIVLTIGLDLGVLSPALFAMLVIMTLVTTFATSPLFQWLLPAGPHQVKAESPPETQQLRDPSAFTILVCVAFDRAGPGLLSLSSAFLNLRQAVQRLYALRLIRPTERTSFYMKDEVEQQAASGLAPLLDRARALEVPVHTLAFVSSDPASDICNVAEVKGADLVVLGWHKPLLSQTLLGGTVHEVMDAARTDVAVFIDRGLSELRRVLVPYYGSPHDLATLGLARRLVHTKGANVTILHVINPDRAGDEPRLGAQAMVEESFASSSHPESKVDFKVLVHADPAQAALEEAENGYDLVMVGVGAEWGLEHRLFGIRPEKLIQDCPTSLMIVRKYLPRPVSEGGFSEAS